MDGELLLVVLSSVAQQEVENISSNVKKGLARENYNLPKSENSRSPETPKEKEEAIIEAFRHFRMI